MARTESSPNAQSAKPQRGRIRRFFTWVFIVFRLLGLISAVDAVMSPRTSQGAIAWSLGLVTVPVVAVPAYWMFGRGKFEGYLEARRDNQAEYDEPFNRELEAMFENDIQQCAPIDPATFKDKPWYWLFGV